MRKDCPLWSRPLDPAVAAFSLLICIAVSVPSWADEYTPMVPHPEQLGRVHPEKKIEAGKPIGIAWEGCVDGRYIYNYTISAGINKGDAWLCCVPTNVLLEDSFRCGESVPVQIASLGTPSDQKVQSCLLLHPLAVAYTTIRACKPAATSVTTTPR